MPSAIGPFSFAVRPYCVLALEADDDTFVSNKTATGRDNGTGNLAFGAHFTPKPLGGGMESDGTCSADAKPSLRFDYVVSVPVPGTFEGTELGHQMKSTFSKPFSNAKNEFLGALTLTGGGQISGVSSGGITSNALVSANYFCNFRPTIQNNAWGAEFELDGSSASALSPSSATFQLAFDGSLDRVRASEPHKWLIRFGLSTGITAYASKVSPFFTLQYSGSFKKAKPAAPPSVLQE